MKKVLPPTYFLLALVVMAVLNFLWPLRRYLEFPLRLAGLVPLACGAILNLLADRQFKRHHTTVKPFETSSALVTAFPFSFSRHPMYLGMTLILLGVALLLGTASVLIPVAAFAILMDVHFIRAEERMLSDSFSREWEQFRARVRRWF
jgi:protein-S-isoprenylcysteine O-methyltransferase Ste14